MVGFKTNGISILLQGHSGSLQISATNGSDSILKRQFPPPNSPKVALQTLLESYLDNWRRPLSLIWTIQDPPYRFAVVWAIERNPNPPLEKDPEKVSKTLILLSAISRSRV